MARSPDFLARVALLRAAQDTFAEKGLSDAKVEEIAHRAGLSKGAFYLHFQSKEEAFTQVVESFLSRCEAIFEPLPDESQEMPTEPDALLDFALEQDLAMMELLWQNRALLRIVEGCHGPYAYLLQSFVERSHQRAKQWIVLWQGIGVLRQDVDPDLVASLILGGYRRLTRRMVQSDRKPPLRDWLVETQRLYMLGAGSETTIAALKHQDRSTPGGGGERKRREGDSMSPSPGRDRKARTRMTT